MGITTFSGPVKTGSITSTGNSVLSSGIQNTHPLGNVATQRHGVPQAAAATAEVSISSAFRMDKGKLTGDKKNREWKTRKDPFAKVWDDLTARIGISMKSNAQNMGSNHDFDDFPVFH